MTGSVPGEWKWGDNTLLYYNPWHAGEPDYSAETVAMIYLPTTKMADIPTYKLKSFICEKQTAITPQQM